MQNAELSVRFAGYFPAVFENGREDIPPEAASVCIVDTVLDNVIIASSETTNYASAFFMADTDIELGFSNVCFDMVTSPRADFEYVVITNLG